MDEQDYVSVLKLHKEKHNSTEILECIPEISIMKVDAGEYLLEDTSSEDNENYIMETYADRLSSSPSLTYKNFVCHTCNCCFSERVDLVEHKKVHKKEKEIVPNALHQKHPKLKR